VSADTPFDDFHLPPDKEGALRRASRAEAGGRLMTMTATVLRPAERAEEVAKCEV